MPKGCFEIRALLLIPVLSLSLLSSLAYGVVGDACGDNSGSSDSGCNPSVDSDGEGGGVSLEPLIRLIMSLPYPFNWLFSLLHSSE